MAFTLMLTLAGSALFAKSPYTTHFGINSVKMVTDTLPKDTIPKKDTTVMANTIKQIREKATLSSSSQKNYAMREQSVMAASKKEKTISGK